jgi:hypothetical protein
MPFDYELERMLIKTINVRRPTGLAEDGTETLAAAVAVTAYEEVVDATKDHAAGAYQRDVTHFLVIKDWPSTLPGGIRYDDWVFMPGADTNDLTQGKKPVTINKFNDPELGDVDHYEVTL